LRMMKRCLDLSPIAAIRGEFPFASLKRALLGRQLFQIGSKLARDRAVPGKAIESGKVAQQGGFRIRKSIQKTACRRSIRRKGPGDRGLQIRRHPEIFSIFGSQFIRCAEPYLERSSGIVVFVAHTAAFCTTGTRTGMREHASIIEVCIYIQLIFAIRETPGTTRRFIAGAGDWRPAISPSIRRRTACRARSPSVVFPSRPAPRCTWARFPGLRS
jgi:hypothetical protein